LNATVSSDALAKQRVGLSGWLPDAQGQAVFEPMGERLIRASSSWRPTQPHGKRLQTAVEPQRQPVSVERVVLPAALFDHHQPKAVSLDGGMVNLRRDGWRELKLGAGFDLETRLEPNPQTQQLDQMAHGVNVHDTAVLGSKDDFTPALWSLAVEPDGPTAPEPAVIADGALWIWTVAEEVCPDGRQIVDWFHAVHHLAEPAAALYPDENDSAKRARWLTLHQAHLYLGRIHTLIAALHQRPQADLAGYFERHQRRMQSLEFREAGFPIGSGTVESGVKPFKQRLTGTGMRWNADNADRMPVIRAAVLGNEFDTLCKVA
jgi:hypothetical protein